VDMELNDQSRYYIICRTCGKYVPSNKAEKGGYCSFLCAVSFGQCITCGRHVPRESLFEKHFCSAECSVQYRFLKTMGPRPVIIASDQTTNDPDDILI
jgi:endogenous inhibitor of DNA gyrase (YacG/DUF329 family)